jgi:hypothetical protein
VLDFNRTSLSDSAVSIAINNAINHAEPPEENTRQYLGASSIGSECLRKIQFDWMVDATHPNQTRDVFRRGHLIEELSRQQAQHHRHHQAAVAASSEAGRQLHDHVSVDRPSAVLQHSLLLT